MKLTNLLKNDEIQPCEDIDFQRLVNDSRQVSSGDLFVAITCDKVIEHIITAVKKGACGVVVDELIYKQNHTILPQSQYIIVKNSRETLSKLAQRCYPGQPKHIAAVTGTNGKSSVTTFVRQIWELLGVEAASFGTLGLELTAATKERMGNFSLPKLTTPDAISLHQLLQVLTQENVDHFVFEASSHGLDQYRVHGANVTVAGFTNLTQDHLDYHPNMEAYFEAKSKLFTEVLIKEGKAVLNIDSPYSNSLKLLVKVRGGDVITYGVGSESADLVAKNIRHHPTSIEFDFVATGRTWPKINIPVVGSFQIENILCAIGIVAAEGVLIESIVKVLPQLKSALGRMQLAGKTSKNAAIYVDYAHTPDALQRSLTALRSHLPEAAKLHVVFGCGGNRDTGKRAAMGAVANDFADVVYVTDDNPRNEDPTFIRAQVLAGCPKGQEVSDRYQAILKAIQGLGVNDILLVAGKGHETGQVVYNNIIPFDDTEVVSSIVRKL